MGETTGHRKQLELRQIYMSQADSHLAVARQQLAKGNISVVKTLLQTAYQALEKLNGK